MVDPLEEIRKGYVRGWSFVQLNGKAPVGDGWQRRPRESLDEAIAWAHQGNVGLRTGAASGIAVIDLEAEVADTWKDYPETVTAITGGNGYHLYYRCSRPVKNSCGRVREDGRVSKQAIAPHVDVRGDGGQVVFVGSVHPETGNQYRWGWPRSPDQIEFAEFPYDLIPAPPEPKPAPPVRPARRRSSLAITPVRRCALYISRWQSISGQGGHDQAFKAACKCFQFGLTQGEAWEVMSWWNGRNCVPPWSDYELRHKLDDAERVVASNGEFGMFINEEPEPAQPRVLTLDEITSY